YERRGGRRGYRNGVRERTLTGPTGPVALTLPRATLFSGAGDAKEWTSSIVPRYQRRMPEVNEAALAAPRPDAARPAMKRLAETVLKVAALLAIDRTTTGNAVTDPSDFDVAAQMAARWQTTTLAISRTSGA